ncbi:MAG: nucleotidyltransferase domain-containing protein [Saprospiraceae bacterium]
MIDNYLNSKLEEIHEACKIYNVVNLYAFGSIVDGRFKKGESDIDLMVEFDSKKFSKKENSKHLLKLWIELQRILDAKVDLITNENIKGEYFKKYLELYKKNIYRKNTEATNR